MHVQTTLRQEGIALPGRYSMAAQKQCKEKDGQKSTQPPPTPEADYELVHNNLEATDFKAVLKDLQVLSASLLEMDNEHTS